MEAALQAMNKMTQAQPNHPRYQPKSSRKQHRGAGRVPFTRTPLPTSRVQPNTNSHHNNDNSNSNDSRAPFAADHSAAAIRDSDALPKSSSMSASGKALWTWFEQLSLHIPASPASASGVTADAVSTQWIKLLTVHVTDRRWQDNVAVLQKELRRVQMQPLSAVTLSHLQSFLCCRNWGKDDIRQVIAQAVRLQAGRIQPQILLQQQQQQPQPQPQQLCKQGDSDNKDNEQWKEEPHLIEAAKKDDAIDFWGESTQPHTVDGASASSSSPTDTHQQHGTGTIDVGEKSHEAAVMKAERELSRWSLQRAFAQQLNAATSAAGNGDVHPSENGMTPHPAVVSSQHSSIRPRSREELLQQFTLDKYERNLLSNVVFPHEIDVSYADIGGLDQVKKLLRQSITYPLKYPDLYSEGIAREAVKGVLLFGPPGTGKTLLAKAVATEGGASFINVDASTIENKWLGESEKNARAVFSLARKLAPCVVFFDEVDSLLSSREHGTDDTSAHGTLTSVKTTLMAEWDGLTSHLTQSSSPADSSAGGATHHQHHNGNNNNMDNLPLDGGDSAVGTELLLDLNAATFADIDSLFFSPSAELDAASVSALLCDNHRPALATGSCAPVSGNMSSGTSKGTKQPNKSKQNRVIVIASTNRPFDLDEAVLRRLPRRIFVDLPDLATRQAILAVNLAHNNVDFNSVNLTEIAMRLEGFTGSDIKEICREAVVTIAHEQAEQFEQQQQQQQTLATNGNQWGNILREEAGDGGGIEGDAQDRGLRPLTARDLYRAMRRLRASVNENGRELQKVIEWNEKYGEFRQDNAHVEGHGESNASNASLSGYPIGSSAGSGGRGRGRRTELYL
jgi:SpoVK/Ycf46/Vps4 family AAA+-type ATPase